MSRSQIICKSSAQFRWYEGDLSDLPLTYYPKVWGGPSCNLALNNLVQQLCASRREIQDLLVVHHNVKHGSCAQILEVERQLRTAVSVDSGMTRLPRSCFEALADDNLIASVVLAGDSEDVIA